MKKSYRKCVPKASPGPLFYYGKQPKQPLHARNYFKNIFISKGGLSKPLKLTFFSLLNPVLFNGQTHQKQKGPGTSDQSLFRLQNKFRKNS